MLNEFWQSEVGDFTLDTSRFPTIKDTINIIHRRGFRIVLTIQPFISTESSNFAEAVKKGYLVRMNIDSLHGWKDEGVYIAKETIERMLNPFNESNNFPEICQFIFYDL